MTDELQQMLKAEREIWKQKTQQSETDDSTGLFSELLESLLFLFKENSLGSKRGSVTPHITCTSTWSFGK